MAGNKEIRELNGGVPVAPEGTDLAVVQRGAGDGSYKPVLLSALKNYIGIPTVGTGEEYTYQNHGEALSAGEKIVIQNSNVTETGDITHAQEYIIINEGSYAIITGEFNWNLVSTKLTFIGGANIYYEFSESKIFFNGSGTIDGDDLYISNDSEVADAWACAEDSIFFSLKNLTYHIGFNVNNPKLHYNKYSKIETLSIKCGAIAPTKYTNATNVLVMGEDSHVGTVKIPPYFSDFTNVEPTINGASKATIDKIILTKPTPRTPGPMSIKILNFGSINYIEQASDFTATCYVLVENMSDYCVLRDANLSGGKCFTTGTNATVLENVRAIEIEHTSGNRHRMTNCSADNFIHDNAIVSYTSYNNDMTRFYSSPNWVYRNYTYGNTGVVVVKNDTLLWNAEGGSSTYVLPDDPKIGDIIRAFKTDVSANTVIALAPPGATISGDHTIVLQYSHRTIECIAANTWFAY